MKSVFSVSDESCQSANAASYVLSLQVGADAFAYSIYDSPRNKMLAVNLFADTTAKSQDRGKGYIEKCLALLPFQKVKFKSVNASFISPQSTLVPTAIYDKTRAEEYLKFNHIHEPGMQVHANYIRLADAWNVYAVHAAEGQALERAFPGVQIHHYSSCFIAAVLSKNKNSHEKIITLNVRASGFELVISEGGQLLFYNTFAHQTPEDFMYFLMFTCDRLALNPEKINLVVMGEIEKKSAIWNLLYKYFRNVKFGDRNESMLYAYGFNDFPAHYFYTLLSQIACAS